MVSYRQLAHFLWKFLRRQKGTFFTVFFLDSLSWPLDSLLWPYLLSRLIGIFTQFDGDRAAAWNALPTLLISGVCLMLFIEIASRTMGILMSKASPKLQADIRMEVFDHIQHHSPHYFNERFAGSLANKITDMTTQVDQIITQLYWPIWPAFVACFVGTIVLWSIHPLFGLILGIWILVHVAAVLLCTRSIDVYQYQHGQARSALLGKIVDSFTNNFSVNLFYRFSHEKNSLLSDQHVEEKTNLQARLYAEKVNCFISCIFLLGNFLSINGTLIYLWLQQQLTTGQVVQVFNTAWNLSMIMWVISRALPLFFQSIGTAKQAYSVMQDPQDIGDPLHAFPLQVRQGQIIFDDVSFQYAENHLFHNQNIQIQGGEKVGIVGPTGAGKSTFINLILRFFPLQSGKILIDGQDIATITLESLRRQIMLIPQEPVLFHRSLRENIAYGKPTASEEQIVQAATLAHCDEFIRHIPGGYCAKVGERGTKLSGGEKQRIAIARAFLVDAPILILDEATSALDSVTERHVQNSLESLMQNRTTIVIAHRLSTLARMDRILVFDQGKVVEEGSHETLLHKEGLYARMWSLQAGGFLPEALLTK